jgi:rhodanese-related sulfurtransferase
MDDSTSPNEPAAPLEVSVAQAHRQFHHVDGTPRAVLLDVREPDEIAICAVEGSTHIPMGQIPERADRLPRDRPVMVLCHHGGRSLKVAQFLRAKGFEQASSVKGGIDQWAVQFDPAMRRY